MIYKDTKNQINPVSINIQRKSPKLLNKQKFKEMYDFKIYDLEDLWPQNSILTKINFLPWIISYHASLLEKTW